MIDSRNVSGLCQNCYNAKKRRERDAIVASERAARPAPAPPPEPARCACGTKLSDENLSGICQGCIRARAAEKREQERLERVAAAERRAEGVTTPEDELKRENTSLRRALDAADRALVNSRAEASLEERILEEITGYLERNPYRPSFEPVERRAPSSNDHEMLALVSDAHFPEVVDPASAFGFSYNAETCRRRMERLRDTIVRYIDLRRSAYPIRRVTLAVLGDMLSGDIHEELEVTNEMPIAEAMPKMAYMLLDLGNGVAAEVEEVEVVILPGNHPRLSKKPRYKQHWNNWETVMGEFVAGLAQKSFKVIVPRDKVYRHRIFGFNVGLTHGDGVKAASFAGIPWYSLDRRRNALQALLKTAQQQQLDLLCYGHFHQLIFEEGQGCSVIINGAIKGGDEFSIGTRYSAQPAVQALLTWHAKYGITDLSRINLGGIQ
jgi:predicted phosphodiesterase